MALDTNHNYGIILYQNGQVKPIESFPDEEEMERAYKTMVKRDRKSRLIPVVKNTLGGEWITTSSRDKPRYVILPRLVISSYPL